MARCNAKFCELTDAKFEGGEYFRPHERAMTERADSGGIMTRLWLHEPSVIASTMWTGRDAVDQDWTL